MNNKEKISFQSGNAICYSGFREGQQPGGITPGYAEIREDLLILQHQWKYLRLFDCDEHAAVWPATPIRVSETKTYSGRTGFVLRYRVAGYCYQ